MHTLRARLKYNPRSLQKCPFCQEEQPFFIKGIAENPLDLTRGFVEDKGYSFCNCKNILFTDWSNIDQRIYDEDYTVKYRNPEWEEIHKVTAKENVASLIKHGDFLTLLEIGSINNYVLDEVFSKSISVTGIDINPQSADQKHRKFIGDFETYDFKHLKYDLIYASHVWEHLHYPLEALKKAYNMLNDNGCIYIAMPDPFFINWNNIYDWGHWNIREHHIFWDMDSFIEEAEKIGFTCIDKRRNDILRHLCIRDFHLIFRKNV